MRIIGYVEHPTLKITVFYMNNRISVQFESGSFSQIYKIREQDEIKTIGDVQGLVDEDFINAVLKEMMTMNQIQNAAFSRFLSSEEEEEFEEII